MQLDVEAKGWIVHDGSARALRSRRGGADR